MVGGGVELTWSVMDLQAMGAKLVWVKQGLGHLIAKEEGLSKFKDDHFTS